ncbi:hypothetical protein cyc_02146 [Cyclospora cayetanensis]|uniref:Uncharacterized protein n=1 Tax=Cyclospora cayetanensis TaxID=88456 RepID=A0A1D3CTT4_9EIME|nr:hypothetical protein cyc_02146 [Cyclospora cayetanensis]
MAAAGDNTGEELRPPGENAELSKYPKDAHDDDRLDFCSPNFDPLLLLRQKPSAAGVNCSGAEAIFPNIRVAELLLPWGHQPQSIAAAAAAEDKELKGAEAAASQAPGPQEGAQESKKRTAFEAKLNAAKNKQLKLG